MLAHMTDEEPTDMSKKLAQENPGPLEHVWENYL